MRKPDEIMAEYLLKGGKMLAKSCPDCGSPLFEYKGETYCVVCREDQSDQQKTDKSGNIEDKSVDNPSSGKKKHPESGNQNESLHDAFALTIRSLLMQAREEQDIRRLRDLMKVVKVAAEAYAILNVRV